MDFTPFFDRWKCIYGIQHGSVNRTCLKFIRIGVSDGIRFQIPTLLSETNQYTSIVIHLPTMWKKQVYSVICIKIIWMELMFYETQSISILQLVHIVLIWLMFVNYTFPKLIRDSIHAESMILWNRSEPLSISQWGSISKHLVCNITTLSELIIWFKMKFQLEFAALDWQFNSKLQFWIELKFHLNSKL